MLAGWRAYLLLPVFFIIGAGCTRLGYRRKELAALAEARGGRRGWGSAVANVGVAVLAALLAALTHHTLFLAALAGALAAAAADTAASEIGQLWGRPTYLVTTGRRVPAGTDGGVSLVGSVAALGAAAAVAAVGGWADLYPAPAAARITLAGLLAILLKSVIGATLERRGLLGNHAVNLLNTLFGALLAALFLHV